jgi:hypothetical protein
MSVTLINGDGNPRVLASQDADWYGALTGEKTCIVPINDNLSATITDSNTIEIGSGVCITKEGRRVQIDEGDIEEIIIPTGTQGTDTYYIIGFHLYINELGQQVAETFVETMASATDTITETTFKEGSSSIYVSLYRVKRSGLLMDSVTQIIPTLKTIVDINDTLGSTDISAIGDGTVTGGLSRLNSDLPFYDTTNVTPIGSFQNPIKTYTATFDCIACCRIAANLGLGQIEVKVNNETVYAQYNANPSYDMLTWQSIPLKSGQTVTISGQANDNYIAKIIGVGK